MASPEPRFVVNTGSATPDVDEEPEEPLYTPFRDWMGAKPGRPVLVAAVALLLLQALVRGYVKFGGWFMYDDFPFIGRAASLPLWSSEYLLQGWNGHFMPGAFVLVRVLTDLAPVDYRMVAVTDLALQAVAGALVYTLLAAMFGRRPAILVPLSLYLFSAITLPAFLWWAAALNQVPGQIAMAAVLLSQLKYHRTGASRYGVLGAAAALAGLLFSEKVLLVIPCVGLLTLFWFTGGPPARRLRRALTEHWRVWVAYLVVVLPYAALYAAHVEPPTTGAARSTIVVQTVGTALAQAVLPALFGGPFHWLRLGVGGIAAPSDGVVVASAIAAALVVALSIVRRSRASFAWFVVAAYWLANALLLGITRASIVGPLIGREYRYSTDVCLVVAVFGSLAFLPLQGRFAKGEAQHLRRRGSVRREASRPGAAYPLNGIQPSERVLATSLSIALTVAALISTLRFDTVWRNEQSHRFFDTLRADIQGAGHAVTIADLPFPSTALPEPLGAGVSTATFLPALRPRPRILREGDATERLFTLDEEGHVRAAYIDGYANVAGPEGECGYRVEVDPVTIPLKGTTFPWGWGVRVGYLASEEAEIEITAGDVTSTTHILPGVHQIFVMGASAVGEVRLSGLTAGALCTNEVVVGSIKPVPGTRP